MDKNKHGLSLDDYIIGALMLYTVSLNYNCLNSTQIGYHYFVLVSTKNSKGRS